MGEIRDCLRELLGSHERFTGRRQHGRLAGPAPQYDPDAVHTDVRVPLVVQGLTACLAQPKEGRLPVNLLFWGMAGTGKTAFAQHLARQLGKELLLRRASDLLSMFVGGTEQKIQEAFEQADHEDAILFLDEADSFFIDRQTAMRSWETSQTNELLTQMENHHGILICCTNLVDHLDHAAMRRFAWKVKFLPLAREMKARVFERYFPVDTEELSQALQTRIAAIPDLTPGDIKTVWQRYRFMASGTLCHSEVVAALEEEVRYKSMRTGKKIGF